MSELKFISITQAIIWGTLDDVQKLVEKGAVIAKSCIATARIVGATHIEKYLMAVDKRRKRKWKIDLL